MAGFTTIENDLLDSESLSIQEQSLLIAMISFYNKEKGYAYPSYQKLMKRSKIKSKSTFINTLNNLINKKYITRETIKGIGCRYFIKSSLLSTDMNQVQKCTKSKNVQTPGTEVYQHLVQKCTTTNTNTNTKTNTKYIDLRFIDDVIDKVRITQEQYFKLVDKFNKDIVHKNIIALDNYVANGKGNKYKDHYRVLNTWCSKEKSNNLNKEQIQTDNSWAGMKNFN